MTWYPHTVTVPASAEVVSLASAKTHCKAEGTFHDTEITAFIAAALGHIEDYCGTPLASRTVTAKCDGFCDFALFPVVPLQSVAAVSYVDSAGATQTLSTDVYEVRADRLTASLVLKSGQSWPSIQSGSRITVTAVVGYSAVPEAVRQAALLLIGFWFDNRAAASEKPASEIPHAVNSLLANHRSFSF
jgi:uncharacterized phiE125 gp8 family phage protein